MKGFVPDVTKCTYNVYCYGKKAEVKSITDVVWHDDEEWQKPYYSFLLTAVQGGKEYKQTVTMKLVREDSEEGSENGMTWLSLDADGEKYELEQSLHDEEGEKLDIILKIKKLILQRFKMQKILNLLVSNEDKRIQRCNEKKSAMIIL